jgi:peptidoglycan L-alanyl-D-glutamate endopeptidase CwlK
VNTRIEDLTPNVQMLARKCLDILESWKIPHVVTSTFRTEAEQKALFAQGRKPLAYVNQLRAVAGLAYIVEAENTYVVTNADGVVNRSNHQAGRALDIVPADENGNAIWPAADHPGWKRIAEVMRVNGFKWGGDWPRFPDLPHYEA